MSDFVIAGIILGVFPGVLAGLLSFEIENFFYSLLESKFEHLPMMIGTFILALIGALAGEVFGFFAGSTWNFIIAGAFVGIITMILIALGARDSGDGFLGIILIGVVGGGVWGYISILLAQWLILNPIYILVTLVIIICIVGFVLLLDNKKNKHHFFSRMSASL